MPFKIFIGSNLHFIANCFIDFKCKYGKNIGCSLMYSFQHSLNFHYIYHNNISRKQLVTINERYVRLRVVMWKLPKWCLHVYWSILFHLQSTFTFFVWHCCTVHDSGTHILFYISTWKSIRNLKNLKNLTKNIFVNILLCSNWLIDDWMCVSCLDNMHVKKIMLRITYLRHIFHSNFSMC